MSKYIKSPYDRGDVKPGRHRPKVKRKKSDDNIPGPKDLDRLRGKL